MVVEVILPAMVIVVPPVLDGQVLFPIAWKRGHARSAASLGDPVAVIGRRPVGHGEHHHQRSRRAARRPQSQRPGAGPSGGWRCRRPVRSSFVESPIHGFLPVDGALGPMPGRCVRGPCSKPRASDRGGAPQRACSGEARLRGCRRWPDPPPPGGSRREPGRFRGRPGPGSWSDGACLPRRFRTAGRRLLRIPFADVATVGWRGGGPREGCGSIRRQGWRIQLERQRVARTPPGLRHRRDRRPVPNPPPPPQHCRQGRA